MKLIIICGNRNSYLLNEFSHAIPTLTSICYEAAEDFILDLKRGVYHLEVLELLLMDSGFRDSDYEPVVTMLNSLSKKKSFSMKILLITKNKKLYFCWKTYAEKNRNMTLEYISDPLITSGHILYYSMPFLLEPKTLEEKSIGEKSIEGKSIGDNSIEDNQPMEVSDEGEHHSNLKFFMDTNTYSEIFRDQTICITGSDWPMVLEVERLVSNQLQGNKALKKQLSRKESIKIQPVKNRDLLNNMDKWERIYLVNNEELKSSMENQTLLLYLQNGHSISSLNKKIRILEADTVSSKILVHSVKDFLTRF